jgi:hypothetical protein
MIRKKLENKILNSKKLLVESPGVKVRANPLTKTSNLSRPVKLTRKRINSKSRRPAIFVKSPNIKNL